MNLTLIEIENLSMKKIIVAVTGASGSIYGRKIVESLAGIAELEEIAVVVSRNGAAVMEYEGEKIDVVDGRLVFYSNDDMFAPPASGSADYDAMVIVPCSMGSVGRIASGVSQDLIGRAADVMLKERRPLVVVVRETPLSTIHLHNLSALSECGAIVLPASPSFYSRPGNIEELCDTVVERIIKLLGFGTLRYKWRGGGN